MGQYMNYTNQDVIDAAKEVKSLAGLLKKLGLRVAGGNYDNMKRKLQLLEVDCSHWTGKAWNKGQRQKDWSDYARGRTCKPHLILERGHKCEMCSRETWFDAPITLEVHHIDADRTNNNFDNLQLLCPNCHAVTDSWRGRNKKSYEFT